MHARTQERTYRVCCVVEVYPQRNASGASRESHICPQVLVALDQHPSMDSKSLKQFTTGSFFTHQHAERPQNIPRNLRLGTTAAQMDRVLSFDSGELNQPQLFTKHAIVWLHISIQVRDGNTDSPAGGLCGRGPRLLTCAVAGHQRHELRVKGMAATRLQA